MYFEMVETFIQQDKCALCEGLGWDGKKYFLHVSKKKIRQKLKIILSLARRGPSMYSHSGHAFDVAKAATTFLVTLVTSCT